MENNPVLLAIREEFRLKKENEKKAQAEKPKIKYYCFGSDGKRSILPANIYSIVGFLDWITENKKHIHDKILFENDMQNLIEEFYSL